MTHKFNTWRRLRPAVWVVGTYPPYETCSTITGTDQELYPYSRGSATVFLRSATMFIRRAVHGKFRGSRSTRTDSRPKTTHPTAHQVDKNCPSHPTATLTPSLVTRLHRLAWCLSSGRRDPHPGLPLPACLPCPCSSHRDQGMKLYEMRRRRTYK